MTPCLLGRRKQWLRLEGVGNLLTQHNPCPKLCRPYRSCNLGDRLLVRGIRYVRRKSLRRRLHGQIRELGRGAVYGGSV
jgi:hypothetical protein